jgi:ferrous iron transport protein B
MPATTLPATAAPPALLSIALIGNPNTGKTTLFNALTGMRQRVGNYPGVTVETKKGHFDWHGRRFEVVDLPGTYSLAPHSPDEMVAVDLILGHQEGEKRPDVVVSIVDASNLERNLYLTTQALELGVPVVLALNMIDIAEKQGLVLDIPRLEQQLGLRVVPLQANKGRGLDQLKDALAAVATAPRALPSGPVFPEAFEEETGRLAKAVDQETPAFLVRRLLLDVGGHTEQRLAGRQGDHSPLRAQVQEARKRLADAGCPVPAVEARARYAWIRQALAGCIQRPATRPVTWTDRLDRVLTHRFWGTLVFLGVMFLVFQSIFTFARPLMKGISTGTEWLGDALRGSLPAGPLTSLLADGVIAGVGSVVVFLPQILILFGFIAILEDCGYMARAAFLMDRLMSRCGLSGKSFIPLLSSLACAVPGILATRVIENRRDRLATILVAPLMSCSARLPLYVLLISAFLSAGYPFWLPGVVMFALYALGLVIAPLVALVLKRTLLRGETPVFVMEMPLYKRPSWRTVTRRMFDSGWAFLSRAGTMILATMILVWALLYFPHRDAVGASYEDRVAALEDQIEEQGLKVEKLEEAIEEKRKEIREKPADDPEMAKLTEELEELESRIRPLYLLHEEWKSRSYLGQAGHALEPVFKPLGWDWRVGTAALASFPAREVVVGTLGLVFASGRVEADAIRESEDAGNTRLGRSLQAARWGDAGPKLFTIPVALSLLVFFALCCQCASTLAVIRRETKSWAWPVFTFTYMTVLAYVGAWLTFQIGSRFLL